jgi:hypothetical protein
MKAVVYVLGFSLALAAAPVRAELIYLGDVAGWEVLVDRSLGDGCLIQAEYEDGSLVRIGFDLNVGEGYFTIVNDNWGYLEDGAEYEVNFNLDNEGYSGLATGLHIADMPGVDVYFDNAEFLFHLAKKYTMTVYNDDMNEIMAIDLGGTYHALQSAMDCQEIFGF